LLKHLRHDLGPIRRWVFLEEKEGEEESLCTCAIWKKRRKKKERRKKEEERRNKEDKRQNKNEERKKKGRRTKNEVRNEVDEEEEEEEEEDQKLTIRKLIYMDSTACAACVQDDSISRLPSQKEMKKWKKSRQPKD